MKKTISLILCAALFCSIFAACSNADSSNKTDESVEADNVQIKITTDAHYASLDESSIKAYEKLCNAVLNYESEVKYNVSLTDDVNRLFYTSFPQYILVDGIDFLDDNSGVKITYANDKETQTAKLKEFNNEISKIMIKCGFGKVSKNEYLLNVYLYITKNFTVDNSVTTVFDTVLQKKGMNSTLSGLFEYLLLQNDIKASHLINLETNSIAKMISMAEFNGQKYFFDVTSEIEDNSGKALKYFAMNTARAQMGNGFMFTDNTSADVIEDDTYSKLASSTSYQIKSSKVIAEIKGNDTFEFNLD